MCGQVSVGETHSLTAVTLERAISWDRKVWNSYANLSEVRSRPLTFYQDSQHKSVHAVMLGIQVTKFEMTRFNVCKISICDLQVKTCLIEWVSRATTCYFGFVIPFKHCTAELITADLLLMAHQLPQRPQSQTAASVWCLRLDVKTSLQKLHLTLSTYWSS